LEVPYKFPLVSKTNVAAEAAPLLTVNLYAGCPRFAALWLTWVKMQFVLSRPTLAPSAARERGAPFCDLAGASETRALPEQNESHPFVKGAKEWDAHLNFGKGNLVT